MAPNGQAMPHSLQLTHRLSLSWTAPSTRWMALTGQTVAQGASSQWWHICGADFFITHHLQPRHSLQAVLAMRLRAGGFAGAAADTDSGVSNYKTVHRVILG